MFLMIGTSFAMVIYYCVSTMIQRLTLFVFLALTAVANAQLLVMPQQAFKRGEVLKYRIHYGIIDAGEATIEVANDAMEFDGKPSYHFIGTGRSLGTFDWFFKVRDRYDSWVDEKTLLPRVFLRRVDEGGFIINQDYVFNQSKKQVTVKREGSDKPRNTPKKVFSIPDYTHDILSAFYYARNLDLSHIKPGDTITLNTFFDEEIFPLKMKFAGFETIKTKAGRIQCIKIFPVIQQGRVFKSEEDLAIWISNDKNRIPVRLQANILVGSIKMDLKEYKNLANPGELAVQ